MARRSRSQQNVAKFTLQKPHLGGWHLMCLAEISTPSHPSRLPRDSNGSAVPLATKRRQIYVAKASLKWVAPFLPVLGWLRFTATV